MVSSIAGLTAGSAGKALMHPVDTIKAKLQVLTMPGSQLAETMKLQQANKGSLIFNIARDTVRAEGPLGLYRGFWIHVAGSLPAGGLYFGGYEFFKKMTL